MDNMPICSTEQAIEENRRIAETRKQEGELALGADSSESSTNIQTSESTALTSVTSGETAEQRLWQS